jgi:hypothetical protein
MFDKDFEKNLMWLTRGFVVIWVAAATAAFGLALALIYVAYLLVQKL